MFREGATEKREDQRRETEGNIQERRRIKMGIRVGERENAK